MQLEKQPYTFAGPFCRATVYHFGTGAVIVGSLAGELVAKVFHESDSDAHVESVAKALAYDGVWPREVNPQTGSTWLDLPAVVLPEMGGAL